MNEGEKQGNRDRSRKEKRERKGRERNGVYSLVYFHGLCIREGGKERKGQGKEETVKTKDQKNTE